MAVAKELRGHITTPEMDLAVMDAFDYRKNLIVPNVTSGLGLHECDLLMCRPTMYGVEFELKLTKSDLMKDFKKDHKHESELIKEVYYVVPAEITAVTLQVVPKEYGVIMVKRDKDLKPVATVMREATIRPGARKWTDEERFQLARLGTHRIHKLKRDWINCKRGKS